VGRGAPMERLMERQCGANSVQKERKARANAAKRERHWRSEWRANGAP
jgi:hypothetical protein